MSRSSKVFLIALLVSIAVWFSVTCLIGVAEIKTFTASGPVDTTDSYKLSPAYSDPTFTTSYSWGGFTLTGVHWGLTLPYGSGLLAFLTTLLVARATRRRGAP
jgi:hypothetical protein